MKIYTKTGDTGTTSLFSGKRVAKDDLRIEAYGTVDELNALTGVALAEIENKKLRKTLFNIQNKLFTVGADLASPEDSGNAYKAPRVSDEMIEELEAEIDSYQSLLPEMKCFILPGGRKGASLLHYARTVARRSEREVVKLSKSVEIGEKIVIYLNRLSDLFFVLARYENFVNSTEDIPWKK